MPVTRSSSRQVSQPPSSLPYQSRRAGPSGSGAKKTSNAPSNEVIVLSSDDDEHPSKGTLPPKRSSNRPRKRAAASTVPSILPGDVLEISSDDESQPKKLSPRKQAQSSDAAVKDLQRTIEKLQEELKRSEQLVASASREIQELKRDSSLRNTDKVLSGLEEYTLCEVCTLTMWCPYTLPECGHSFCQDCLVDWFSTTHAQHMGANPHLDVNRAILAGQLRALIPMIPNLHAHGPHGHYHIQPIIAELQRLRPEYTCPSCRKEVLNKPVEDFRLKGLVKEISGLMGETLPRKGTWQHRGSGPFDHFFAAPILGR